MINVLIDACIDAVRVDTLVIIDACSFRMHLPCAMERMEKVVCHRGVRYDPYVNNHP